MDVKNHIIVWLDILGYKELIKKNKLDNKENELLLKVHELMSSLTKYINYNNKQIDKNLRKTDSNHTISMSSFRSLLFSDNILFFAPCSSEIDKINLYTNLANGISSFLFQYPSKELYFRGAITEGNLYYDDDLHFVFGSGLVRAYELESSTAIYPRIIIDDKISIPSILVGYKEDYDGVWFLDYLTYGHSLVELTSNRKEIAQKRIAAMVSIHGTSIQKAIDENKNNEHVLKKYLWLAKYHNAYCIDNAMREYIINL